MDAFARLRHRNPTLLDGLGAHPESRFSYVAFSTRLEARVEAGRCYVREANTATEVHQDPMEFLQGLFDAWRFDAEPGFTGGFVGYFGYEFAAVVEPTLDLPKASTPDAVWRLCRDVLVFDRVNRMVRLWCTDLPGETAATQRAEHVMAELRRDVPAFPEGTLGSWTPSLDQASFENHVRRVKDLVRTGDLFQANIATRFGAACDQDPLDLFRRLAASNPSPFMMLFEADDHAIVSCSPEQLLGWDGRTVRTRPIAGTRPRGQDAAADDALESELRGDPKELAEHTMLVDLLRNDLAKVCVPGTVHVPEAFGIERYRHVMHLVSRVEGQTRAGARLMDLVAALFPGGTITGAPKHRACQRIAEAEPVARGPYTGSGGFVGWGHEAHLNILIRTMVLHDGQVFVHAGAGIVADSNPTKEWLETGNKAKALLEAGASSAQPGGTRLGEVSNADTWAPDDPPASIDARVLLIDHYDSFVNNLADACATLGAKVKVLRSDADWSECIESWQPTHIILGPGPGSPEDAGATWQLAGGDLDLPVLGVCLGHQALAAANGGTVVVHHETVHGKAHTIGHDGEGLFAGMPQFAATRYHSLVVQEPPAGWLVDARLADGTIMAIRDPKKPRFGLQFHPESFCTQGGLRLLLRFLQT